MGQASLTDFYYWVNIAEMDRPGEYLRSLPVHELPDPLKALDGVPQNPSFHPEGCCLTHSCHVIDAMARICHENNVVGHERFLTVMAAICHDFGKATHTKWNEEKQKWVAYGHDYAGVPIADAWMKEIGVDDDDRAKICSLVRCHMVHTRDSISPKAVRKLQKELEPATFRHLLLLVRADCAGRPPLPADLPPVITEQLIPILKELGLE